jgi:hypothetical protein
MTHVFSLKSSANNGDDETSSVPDPGEEARVRFDAK